MKSLKKTMAIFLSIIMVLSVGTNALALTGGTWRKRDREYYHISDSGEQHEGWYLDYDDNWYYLNTLEDGQPGTMRTGWFQDKDSRWYYLNTIQDGIEGSMHIGWFQDQDNDWYWLNPAFNGIERKGQMMTGWIHDGVDWYYCGTDGRWIPSYGNGGTSSGNRSASVDILPDLSGLYYDETEDIYYVSKEMTELKGSLKVFGTSVTSFLMEIKDDQNISIMKRNIPIIQEWTSDAPGLNMGLNEIHFTVSCVNGKTYEKTIRLYNYFSGNMEKMELDRSDEDLDGLIGYLEDYYHTDRLLADTDGDGISDYDEIFILLTDPLNVDSDGNGISDGHEDFDRDGVSNIQEFRHGSNPFMKDTDLDGLDDIEEILKGTRPDLIDTDGDGINDGNEIELGLDPLTTSSEGRIPDGKRFFQQKLGVDRIDPALLNEENAAIPSLGGNVAGSMDHHLNIAKAKADNLKENPIIVGDAVEVFIDYSGFTDLKLSFSVKQSYSEDFLKKLTICQFDQGSFIPLETTTNLETREISAVIQGEGIYCLVNAVELLRDMGIDIEKSLYKKSTETMLPQERQSNNSPNVNDIPEWWEEEQAAAPATPSIATPSNGNWDDLTIDFDETAGQVDLVFVLDTTGSMYSSIDNVKSNINSFVERLNREYNVQVNYALIDSKDITADDHDTTKISKNSDSNWFIDADSYTDKINGLSVKGGGDSPESTIDSLASAERLEFRDHSDKFVILVTDADYHMGNRYGITTIDELIRRFAEKEITVSVISDEAYYENYIPFIQNTNGIFADIYGEFSDELMVLADGIRENTREGYWVMLKGGEYIRLNEKPSPHSGCDTDQDGVADYVELGKLIDQDLTPFLRFVLELEGVPFEEYIGKTSVQVYDYKSHPSKTDTDGDGLLDFNDPHPLVWEVCDRDLAMFAALSYETGTNYENKTIKGSDSEPGERYYFLDFASAGEVFDNWTLVDYTVELASIATHFSASTYRNGNNIIIAFRGTTHEWGTWANNILGVGLINYHSEEGYARAYATMMADRYKDCNIYITGHSLGGYLAQLGAASVLQTRPKTNLEKVAYFNGIGLKFNKLLFWTKNESMETLKRYSNSGKKNNLISYELDGDVVSAIGTHSGKVIRFPVTEAAKINHHGRYGNTAPNFQWNHIFSSIGNIFLAKKAKLMEHVMSTHETDSFFYYLTQGTRHP